MAALQKLVLRRYLQNRNMKDDFDFSLKVLQILPFIQLLNLSLFSSGVYQKQDKKSSQLMFYPGEIEHMHTF